MKDTDAVRQLYEASRARLLRVVLAVCGDRQDAEEAVQEAFAELVARWRQLSSYDDPEAWVRQVAVRKALNAARKRQNGRRALQRVLVPPPVESDVAGAVDLDRALQALPAAQRAVVALHLLGWSHREIATTLQVPEGTVKSRFSSARRTLGPLLADGGDT